MKALTIHQPWATLKVIGAKEYETRGWKTNYRGPIAIHASMKDPLAIMKTLPAETQRVMFDCLYKHYGQTGGALQQLQTGAILAIGDLVECWSITTGRAMDGQAMPVIQKDNRDGTATERPPRGSNSEILLGDWTPGRFAWEIRITKVLDQPYFIKGKQGLWNFDTALLADQDTIQPLLQSAT